MEYILDVVSILSNIFSNKYFFVVFIFIPFGIGVIIGCSSWTEDKPIYYLDLYKEILDSKILRSFIKLLLIIIFFIPQTVFYLTYFLVSFKFIPYILYKDRKFL